MFLNLAKKLKDALSYLENKINNKTNFPNGKSIIYNFENIKVGFTAPANGYLQYHVFNNSDSVGYVLIDLSNGISKNMLVTPRNYVRDTVPMKKGDRINAISISFPYKTHNSSFLLVD